MIQRIISYFIIRIFLTIIFCNLKIPDLTIEDRIHLWTFFLQKSNLILQGEKDEDKTNSI